MADRLGKGFGNKSFELLNGCFLGVGIVIVHDGGGDTGDIA
ncbi:hypothetical protein [Coleofasciculus sp. G2-EDA-02]